MRQAYVTLLSSADYLDAVLVLNASLKNVKSQYPLLVALTKDIASESIKNILKRHKILFEEIPLLSYSDHVIAEHVGKRVLNTASKMQIFTFKNWDKLVFLDADTLILKNIDDLFDYPDGSMVKYPHDVGGFSGLFVFEPRNHFEDEYYPVILKNCNCFDGDLLNKTWFFVRTSQQHQIPAEYLWQYHQEYPIVPSDVKVIHFCNEFKPWINKNFQTGFYIPWLYKYYLDQVGYGEI